MFVFLFLLFLYLYWLASSWCFCSHYFVYYFPRYGHARQVIDPCFREAHCTSCNVMRQCPSRGSNCAFYFSTTSLVFSSTTSLVFSFLYTTVTSWLCFSFMTALVLCHSPPWLCFSFIYATVWAVLLLLLSSSRADCASFIHRYSPACLCAHALAHPFRSTPS